MIYHILRSQQYSREDLERLFWDTDEIRRLYENSLGKKDLRTRLEGKSMFAVFYEPSTRTRFSFCIAAANLGMTAIWTENAGEFSSAVKGETLADTIRALGELGGDVIVLRHPDVGAAEQAAAIVRKFGYNTAIINAGDGTGQHPTQALLDLYTVKRELGRLDNMTVVVGGDLANGRTVHSLVYLLSKFDDINFIFLSPPKLTMSKGILDHLQEHGIKFTETQDKEWALRQADLIYWTRIQTERGSTNATLDLTIGEPELRLIKPNARILHPLPRVSEIKTVVDEDPRAAYFRQISNGMFIRMALLEKACGGFLE